MIFIEGAMSQLQQTIWSGLWSWWMNF